jgi:predicted enzyme related to lactoylglutathione lyase
MPEVEEFQPGLPSWADLSSPDPDESASFYAEILGWEAEEGENPEETGGYRIFTKDGKQIAGLMKIQNEDQPPSWNTYIAVSDADEIAEKVKEADGDVVVEPMDVMDLGRMAFFSDPTGAAFGVWQAKEHKGADIVSEPGATAWHQVNTRDPEKAEQFYTSVFGWDSEQIDTGGADYWQWKTDDKLVGGMLRMGDDFPEEVPPHWIVYFAVEDTDEATEKAKEKGATVRVEPMDIEAGRFAVFTDPHGAAFALIHQGAGEAVEGEEQGQQQQGEDEQDDEDQNGDGDQNGDEDQNGGED